MISIREYEPEDAERVAELHALQGLHYELPDLDSMSVRVVIEDDGMVTHAAFLRQTSEAYWLFDPSETRKEKIGRLLILQKEMSKLAKELGIEDVSCWVPPEISSQSSFDRTMLRLGWQKPIWTDYHMEIR